MYLKIFFNLILLIILSAVQIFFISGLPVWFNHLNFVLVVLIFILAINGFESALWWSLGTGFLLDIYSFFPFGLYLICLPATILIANFLLTSYFTNRSLYSFLALSLISTALFIMIYYFIVYILKFFLQGLDFSFGISFWNGILAQIILNSILALIIFYLTSYLSNKLKPVFILKRK